MHQSCSSSHTTLSQLFLYFAGNGVKKLLNISKLFKNYFLKVAQKKLQKNIKFFYFHF